MTGTNADVTWQVRDVTCNMCDQLISMYVVYWLLETRMTARQLKPSPVFMEEEDYSHDRMMSTCGLSSQIWVERNTDLKFL